MIIIPTEKPNYHIVFSTSLLLCVFYYLFELFYGNIAETHSGQSLIERAFLMGMVVLIVFGLFETAIKHIFYSPTTEGIIAWHVGQALASGIAAFFTDNYFEGHPTWEVEDFFLFILIYSLACVPGIMIGYILHKKGTVTGFDEDLKYIVIRSKGKEELVVDPRDIMFVMEEDKSIRVFFLENSEITSKLIEKSLYSFEKEFYDIPFLLRCHHAYLVNINQVSEIVRDKQEILLHYSSQYIIPVELKYKAKILDSIK